MPQSKPLPGQMVRILVALGLASCARGETSMLTEPESIEGPTSIHTSSMDADGTNAALIAVNALSDRTEREIARYIIAQSSLLPHKRSITASPFATPCPQSSGVFWFGSEQLKDTGDRLRARQCGLRSMLAGTGGQLGWTWAAALEAEGEIEGLPALKVMAENPGRNKPEILDSWWLLGPTPRRVDGFGPDLVEQHGGAHALGREAVLDSATAGVVQWRSARTHADRTFDTDMRPFWGRADSTDARDQQMWQGWARGALWIPSRQSVSLGCVGVALFTLDGEPMAGSPVPKSALVPDPNIDPDPRVPAAWTTTAELAPGLHVLAAHVTETSGRVGCMLRPADITVDDAATATQTDANTAPATPEYLDVKLPPFLPDLLEGLLLSGGFALPITNRHPTKWMRNVKVVVTGRLWSVNQTNPVIPPGQTHLMRVHLTGMPMFTEDGATNPAGCRVTESGHVVSILELRVSAPGFGRTKMPLVIHCRRSLGEPFTFTYVDHRGAAQTAVAMAPQFQCPYFRCAVVVSFRLPILHPGDQVLRHTTHNKTAGIRIALHHAWYVTPTWTIDSEQTIVQHRAALESLLLALEMVSQNRVFCFQADACQIVADSNRVLLEGYGADSRLAILLGASMPDRTLGVLATAPDEPLPGALASDTLLEVDFAVAAVLLRQTTWRHIERVGHALNGVPIMFHVAGGAHGAADRARIAQLRNTHRRFQVNATVVVGEDRVGPKWWRDIVGTTTATDLPEDSFYGPVVRELLHVLGKSDIQAFTPEHYTIKVHDPLAQGTKGGITVIAPCDRGIPATITVDYLFDDVHWSHRGFIHTRNVCQLRFHRPPGLSGSPGGSPFDWTNTSVVMVDGHHIPMDGVYNNATALCLPCGDTAACQWESCQIAETPVPWGGVAAVLTHGLKIVYGTGGTEQETVATMSAAILLANLLAADHSRPTPVHVVSDVDLLENAESMEPQHDERLVLLGNPQTHRLLGGERLRLPEASFDRLLGPRVVTNDSRRTVLAVVPEPRLDDLLATSEKPTSRTALVLAAERGGDLLRLVEFFAQVGGDVPDFLVFGPGLSASAATAIELVGHWEVDWTLSSRLLGGPLVSCPFQNKIGPQDGAVFCR